ncbi:MAG: hypothetical protein CFH43_00834 [Proteobacteria bacterium]|nr:MAG: hypothetical protein CFH43_00834 [Pseudomonadota bacterium]
MLKNIWSDDNPAFNPVFHLSITNLRIWAIITLFASYFLHASDMNTGLWIIRSVSAGFVGVLMLKCTYCYEKIYGSNFNNATVMFALIISFIGITVHMIHDPLWRFIALYSILIPVRIALGLTYKKHKSKTKEINSP